MIELDRVRKTYQTNEGTHVVLEDLSICLRPTESFGILGRNGSGKSTLLRIIAGAETPTSGTVRRNCRVSWPIGFTGGLHGALSGEANCRFVARVYGQDVDRVVAETCAFAEIGDYFSMPVRTYSSGMRARLAFGLSMSIDFDLYLVDEVVAVGDKSFRKKCAWALADRRDRAGLVLVSHDSFLLRRHCDRFAVLEAGELRVFDDFADANAYYAERLAA